jgi:hypothetical protein
MASWTEQRAKLQGENGLMFKVDVLNGDEDAYRSISDIGDYVGRVT